MKTTLYATPSCPYSALARDLLKELRVDFDDTDVSNDSVAVQAMVKVSGQMGVPVLVVSDDSGEYVRIAVGWNPTLFREMFDHFEKSAADSKALSAKLAEEELKKKAKT